MDKRNNNNNNNNNENEKKQFNWKQRIHNLILE